MNSLHLFLSLFIPVLLMGCATGSSQTESRSPVRVALVSDASCTDAKSRDAAWNIIGNHPGFDAQQIEAAEADFDAFDVVIFPGGSGSGQAKVLGTEGGGTLTEYVRSGRGVVAICAGGYLVAEGYSNDTSASELVNAKLHDLSNWHRGEGMIQVAVEGEEAPRTMWFQNGPI